MNIQFTKYSKIYYIVSAVLIVASIVSLFAYGLKFGIEFTGGAVIDLTFTNQRPSNDQIKNQLSEF